MPARPSQTSFIDGGSEHRAIYTHHALMSDLAPAQRYFYRVGQPSAGAWSPVYNFSMPPAGFPPVSIAVYGDMGVENARIPDALLRDLRGDAGYDMILHVGDFAYDMNERQGRVGDAFMRMIEPIASHVPYMTCLGNHEVAYNFSHYTHRSGRQCRRAPVPPLSAALTDTQLFRHRDRRAESKQLVLLVRLWPGALCRRQHGGVLQ